MTNMSNLATTEKDKHLAAFEVFDRDWDKEINAIDIAKSLELLGEKLDTEEVQAVLNTVDDNKDGLVNFDEYFKLLSEDPKPKKSRKP